MMAMVGVTWPLLLLASASGFTSVKRDTDTELDREEVADFFEEIENAQEVLEVPLMEYEDDNKPSKMTRAAILPHFVFMLIQRWMRESILYGYCFSPHPRRVGSAGRPGRAALRHRLRARGQGQRVPRPLVQEGLRHSHLQLRLQNRRPRQQGTLVRTCGFW